MFCEKCGTDNRDNATTCSRCGEKLPSPSFCGGFADILSYEEKIPSSSSGADGTSSCFSAEKYDSSIRKLMAQNAKLENKINILSQRFIYVLGGVALALILSFMCLVITPSSSDIKEDYIDDLEKKVAELSSRVYESEESTDSSAITSDSPIPADEKKSLLDYVNDINKEVSSLNP
ncbi:MAG: zinc ribbon domain-containing protein [Oscillospiraceae bacterium]|nr:zinc ribbon domain-containing protein [Oscillospiraceae bacterium]MBQ6845576.1 zinc ribbon domain-containing protein [Oscillospiraceae bacterium]MBQ7118893.1 zinc ribbon domain-containing protein [Oscillospiraceae bacterium]